jgi:ABC-2 type transport system ATP-binding protein
MIAPQSAGATPKAPAIVVRGLSHHYGERRALDAVDLEVQSGEILGLLGPNGGGKTTLFRILATICPPQSGTVRVLGQNPSGALEAVRRRLGVVFQHPGVDGMLTVLENLRCHGALYGLTGTVLEERARAVLARLRLEERADERVATLSGGLARRVELAKGLLHAPELLLLDEPSVGLDPGARREFMDHLVHLRDSEGLTVLLTTHTMEEAERCDRVGIVHAGKIVALGTPQDLTRGIGGDVVVIEAREPERMRQAVRARFGYDLRSVDGMLRLEAPRGHEFVREVVEAFPGDVQSVTFGRPTLEDVFVHVTGRRFGAEDER